ncbi:hypothetical protein [Streptomyces sp. NPDC020362]|uniref:hypothetical protein n=1 Tax=unclassified Streptomyces TaxID=2593676 RepID=UPI000A6B080F
MAAFLGQGLPAREGDVPAPFRDVVRAGWVLDDGALVLAELRSGYVGAGRSGFTDVIHYEATVNGRGMTDYDLPRGGPERARTLLCRSVGYARPALAAVPQGCEWPVLAYVSLSEGGSTDDLLTAHVTFCTERPGVAPYVADLESCREALMELSAPRSGFDGPGR